MIIKVWAFSIDTREIYVSAKMGTLDDLVRELKRNPCFHGIRPRRDRTYFLFKSRLARTHMNKVARLQGYDAQIVIKDMIAHENRHRHETAVTQ